MFNRYNYIDINKNYLNTDFIVVQNEQSEFIFYALNTYNYNLIKIHYDKID